MDWMLHDLHLRGVTFGKNSITVSPTGVGDVVRWSGTQAPVAAGDIGMNKTSGRISMFVDAAARDVAYQGELSGAIQLVNSGNITSSTNVNADTKMFLLNRNGVATRTIVLPAASTVTSSFLILKHVWTSSSGIMTVDPNGVETIAGSTSQIEVPIGGTLVLVSDGTSDWKIIKELADSRDHKQVPIPTTPGTINIRGWAPYAGYVIGIRVRMSTVNTNGDYSVVLTNEDTGNTLLSTASFDMDGLSADTVTDLTLTNTYSDRFLSAGGQWTAAFTNDDISFNGAGIYIEVLYAASGV